MSYSDAQFRAVFDQVKTIACVGVSTNPVRPSYFVARYLGLKGFRVIPVNPVYEGQRLFGETIRASLSDVDTPIDMVDIFRRSEFVPEIVDEALGLSPRPKVIWMQIGVMHDAAATKAEAAGLTVIQDRCPKIEYQRLFGELRKAGFNTGVISSRL